MVRSHDMGLEVGDKRTFEEGNQWLEERRKALREEVGLEERIRREYEVLYQVGEGIGRAVTERIRFVSRDSIRHAIINAHYGACELFVGWLAIEKESRGRPDWERAIHLGAVETAELLQKQKVAFAENVLPTEFE